MKTITPSAKAIKDKKEWRLIDAAGAPLGKVASTVAYYLRGKNKVFYTPHMDDGDYVVVINADKVVLSGKKLTDKIYYKHSGYTGSIKGVRYKDLMKKKPEFVIEKAVKGMLPKNRLGRVQFSHLKVYCGSEHKHQAQRLHKAELR